MQTIFFTKLNHTRETTDLLKDKNAFVLLSLIALRARRKEDYEMHNGGRVFLKYGQAYIGDHSSCGLTEKEYRNAKKRLIQSKYIEVEGTNKGTIATIINANVFDISMNRGADKGQTGGGQRATNRDRKKSKIDKNDNTNLPQGKEGIYEKCN